MIKRDACRVQREACDERTLLVGAGLVSPLELAQENADGLARITGWIVKRIDCQRQTNVLEMHADLVCLAGFREDAQERHLAETLVEFPVGQRRSAVLQHRHAHLRIGVRADRSVDFAFVRFRVSRNKHQVFLLHRVVLKLMREMPLRLDILGEEHHAAGVFVEAMDDAQARIGVATARKIQLRSEAFDQAVGFTAAGNGGQAGRLIDGDEIVVVVQKREG